VSIIVLDQALAKQAIVGAAFFVQASFDHQPGIAFRDLPIAGRVGNAHLQDAAIAINILGVEAVLLVLERIRSRAGADVPRLPGQCPLRAVGVEPRHHVDGLLVKYARDLGVAAIALGQLLDEVERSHRGGHFGGVDVGINPERRLLGVRPGLPVGQHDQRDLPPLVRFAQRGDLHDAGVLLGQPRQAFGQLGVGVVGVEGDVHGGVLW
jgi:hypothetical protein